MLAEGAQLPDPARLRAAAERADVRARRSAMNVDATFPATTRLPGVWRCARDAEGRAAHPHRRLARARAHLRARAAQRRRARRTRASTRCAPRTRSPTCRASSTSTTPARACCVKEDDFYDMAMAYFARAAADNVVHAEIFFDPQTHTDRGVPFATVIDGLVAGVRRRQASCTASTRRSSCASCGTCRRTRRSRRWRRRCRIATSSSASASTAASAAIRRRSSRGCSRAAASWGCIASRMPARRGRPRTSAPRSTSCTPSASTTACAVSRIRRWSRAWRASACR